MPSCTPDSTSEARGFSKRPSSRASRQRSVSAGLAAGASSTASTMLAITPCSGVSAGTAISSDRVVPWIVSRNLCNWIPPAELMLPPNQRVRNAMYLSPARSRAV